MRVGMLAAAIAALGLVGCNGIREARMVLPPALATETDTLPLTGMGGGRSGGFMLAEAPGRFTRSADRLGLFGRTFVNRTGLSSFSLAGGLEGSCRYRESEVNAGVVSLKTDRLALRCGFARDGRPLAAELLIDADEGPLGRLDGGARRLGILWYEGAEITVRSIHRDRAGGLPTPTPLGYVFEVDGRGIGAVETNGVHRVLHLPRDSRYREAVVAGALAIATFWDPAEVGT